MIGIATQTTATSEKNSRKAKKTRADLSLDRAAVRRVASIRNDAVSLEGIVVFSDDKCKMGDALAEILGKAEELKLEKTSCRGLIVSEGRRILLLKQKLSENGQNSELKEELKAAQAELRGHRAKLQELTECFDGYHIALEQIAERCGDPEIRNRAFDFVESHSVAVKLVHRMTRFPDIRKRAKQALPTENDRYYSFVVAPTNHEFEGICLRLLAYMKKERMDPEDKKEVQKRATKLIAKSSIPWGHAKTVIRDLRKTINEMREERGARSISDKQLASSVQAYLDGRISSSVEELKEALGRVREIRGKTDYSI